jgi:chaperonin GroES
MAKKKVKPKKAAAPKKKPKSKKAPVQKQLDLSSLISPLDDRLIVQVETGEKVTAGGLIIPDTAELSGNLQALVLVVGPGHRDDKGRRRPMDVKVGDRVLIAEYAGDKLEILGRKVHILREGDVLGIID